MQREKQKLAENEAEPTNRMTFAEDLTAYRAKLDHSSERPNTKVCRKSRPKLVLESRPDAESIKVRNITSKTVENSLRQFHAEAKPHFPPGAKSAARNSTGASATTIKCALDAVRSARR